MRIPYHTTPHSRYGLFSTVSLARFLSLYISLSWPERKRTHTRIRYTCAHQAPRHHTTVTTQHKLGTNGGVRKRGKTGVESFLCLKNISYFVFTIVGFLSKVTMAAQTDNERRINICITNNQRETKDSPSRLNLRTATGTPEKTWNAVGHRVEGRET